MKENLKMVKKMVMENIIIQRGIDMKGNSSLAWPMEGAYIITLMVKNI